MTGQSPTPRASVSALQPYTPGRPATDEHGSLASNESPFGPSPRVAEAVAAASRVLHRYPDPLSNELVPELGSDG